MEVGRYLSNDASKDLAVPQEALGNGPIGVNYLREFDYCGRVPLLRNRPRQLGHELDLQLRDEAPVLRLETSY
jgi:hypothetical protein